MELQDFIQRLLALIKSRKITNRELALGIGVSERTVSNIFDKGDMKLSQLFQILHFLDVGFDLDNTIDDDEAEDLRKELEAVRLHNKDLRTALEIIGRNK